MGKVLVVAFDGLDKKLIEEFDLDNIVQKEFGDIDNSTDIKSIKTAELFTSLITGYNYEKHGVVGLKKEDEGGENLFDRFLHSIPSKLKKTLNTESTQRLLHRVRPESTFYTRKDIESETVFDKIQNSKDVNVPVYSKNTFLHRKYIAFDIGWGIDVVERDLEAEHHYRKKETLKAIDDGFDFVLSHFFYPDTFQHLHNEEELEEMYRRMDELAGEILNEAEDTFDYIIFMSDHGLPTKDQHNENAFYSCNRELGLEEPHITDFHDLLLELAGKETDSLDI